MQSDNSPRTEAVLLSIQPTGRAGNPSITNTRGDVNPNPPIPGSSVPARPQPGVGGAGCPLANPRRLIVSLVSLVTAVVVLATVLIESGQ